MECPLKFHHYVNQLLTSNNNKQCQELKLPEKVPQLT